MVQIVQVHRKLFSLCLLSNLKRGICVHSTKFCPKPEPVEPKVEGGEILNVYKKRVSSGELHRDEYQLTVIHHLCKLHNEIKDYSPPKQGFFQKVFKMRSNNYNNYIKGLYLYGSVGCGKTMLMDLFYDNCGIKDKSRTHFHSFMLDVHSYIHEYKKKATRSSGVKSLDYDPIRPVAQLISSKTWLLCLDEFQVTDIGDAMILKRLFTELFKNGVIVIATSNRPPDDLYKNGLQRSNFLPFIKVLKEYCSILPLDSGIDYRQKFVPGKHSSFYVKTKCDANEELNRVFKILSSRETDTVRPRTLTIKGRNVFFPITCGHVVDCTFDELCNKPLGAIDYLTMSQVFHTVIIRDIPQMTQREKTQARRFITLIDTFYDNKVRILCSADVPHRQLFVAVEYVESYEDENRKLMDDLGITVDSENAKASIFSGEEELFAFDRTVSRLAEMQTEEYWNRKDV